MKKEKVTNNTLFHAHFTIYDALLKEIYIK